MRASKFVPTVLAISVSLASAACNGSDSTSSLARGAGAEVITREMLRPECADGFISKFEVYDNQFAATIGLGGQNYCLKTGPELTPAYTAAVRQYGAINLKVAAYLGADPAALFGVGLPTGIIRTAAGVLESIFSRATGGVYVAVYQDWNGQELNESVYVHELGHALSAGPSTAVPQVLHDLNTTTLLVETFADFLALNLTGRIFSESKEIPACLGRGRIVGKYQTYGFPRDFFENNYARRKIISCCKLLKDHPSWSDPDSDSLCGLLKGVQEPPLDRQTVFDPQDYVSKRSEFDAHQVGIPVNSFLRVLDKELGINVKEAFFQALRDTTQQDSYKCDLAAEDGAPALTTTVQVTSFEYVLQTLRNEVAADKKEGFEKAWAKHQIDKALVMARFDAESDAAPLKASIAFRDDSRCARFQNFGTCRPTCKRIAAPQGDTH